MSNQTLSRAMNVTSGQQAIVGFDESFDISGSSSSMMNVATSASLTLAQGLQLTRAPPVPAGTPDGGVVGNIDLAENDSNLVFTWEPVANAAVAGKGGPGRPLDAVNLGIHRAIARSTGNLVMSGDTLLVSSNARFIVPITSARYTASEAFEAPGGKANVDASGEFLHVPLLGGLSGNTVLPSKANTSRFASGGAAPLAGLVVAHIDDARVALAEMVVDACARGEVAVVGAYHNGALVDAEKLAGACGLGSASDLPAEIDLLADTQVMRGVGVGAPLAQAAVSGDGYIEYNEFLGLRRDWRVRGDRPCSCWKGPVATRLHGDSTWTVLERADGVLRGPYAETSANYQLRPLAGVPTCADELGIANASVASALGPHGGMLSIDQPGTVSPFDRWANSVVHVPEDLSVLPSVYELVRLVGPREGNAHVVSEFDTAKLLQGMSPSLGALAGQASAPVLSSDWVSARSSMPSTLTLSTPNANEPVIEVMDFAGLRRVHEGPILKTALQQATGVFEGVMCQGTMRVRLGADAVVFDANAQTGAVTLDAGGQQVTGNLAELFVSREVDVTISFSSGEARGSLRVPGGAEVSVSLPVHGTIAAGVDVFGALESLESARAVSARFASFSGAPRLASFEQAFSLGAGSTQTVTLPADYAIEKCAHVVEVVVESGSGVIIAKDGNEDTIASTISSSAKWFAASYAIELECVASSASGVVYVHPSRAVAQLPGVRAGALAHVRMPAFVEAPSTASTLRPLSDVRMTGTVVVGEAVTGNQLIVKATSDLASANVCACSVAAGSVTTFEMTVQSLVDAGLVLASDATERALLLEASTSGGAVWQPLGNVAVRAGPPSDYVDLEDASVYARAARVMDTAGVGAVHEVRAGRFTMTHV